MALTNSQHQEIMRMYDQQRFTNKRDQDARIQKVYQAVPRIRELDISVGRIALAQARRRLLEQGQDTGTFTGELDQIRQEKRALLVSAGFPEDYMELHYSCPYCQDTGYIGNRKCRCFSQKETALLYKQSNLRNLLMEENFDTFSEEWFDPRPVGDMVSPRDNILRIRDICLQMVASFPEGNHSLLLSGPAGTGKTFMTHCIAKALMDASYSVVYLSAAALFDVFSRHQFRNDEDPDLDLMVEQIYHCDLLIIDDLGTEVANNFTISMLFSCINERSRGGKGIVISTNLTLKEIQSHYSERISSRLISSCTLLTFYGADIRIQKKLVEIQ